MNLELLDILRCPRTNEELLLEDQTYVIQDRKVKNGFLISKLSNYKYPIKNFIPRFVSESNYADNFGMQWNMFKRTQLDSHSGYLISEKRFLKATGLTPETINGNYFLDCGCGAGRFAEVVLKYGGNLIAIDYSSAVDACYENLGHYPKLNLIQANIYELPFKKNNFPFVYSLGVLQHTPDVKLAFHCLPKMLTKEGVLCVDFYEDSFKSKLLPKFWLRPITKRLNKKFLFNLLHNVTPFLLKLSILISRVPLIGNLLKRTIPVANYKGILPLNNKQLFEWALLDTFDWLSPEFDNPQKGKTIQKWFEEDNFENIHIFYADHLVGRGNLKA
jgi:2-polyprenyl-3-methyl-5-hydroxy-6-metoxy-1,4-benzoquinol methylase